MRVAELRTPRLRLRGLERRDTEAVLRVFADPETSKYFAADFSVPEQCRAMVERRLAYDGPDELGHWVIERDDTVIGLAHLRPTMELPGALPELGYFIEPAHGGRGLATEAASALIGHGFDTLGLTSIWALIHQDNAPSLKLARRLGFLDVGFGEHYGAPHRVHVLLPDTPRSLVH